MVGDWEKTADSAKFESLMAVSSTVPLDHFLVLSTTPNEGVDGWASREAHVMGTAIPNVLQQGAFVWFEKTQMPLMKVLPVPGWRQMKQMAVRVHFLRYGSLLDDWSVESVLSLIESVSEPDVIGIMIEEVVDLSRQLNLEFDGDDIQEVLDTHNQELIIDELIEMHEQSKTLKNLSV
ncbi:uncharacterized protein TNCV_145611 [Trichonephila clavipes]|nr:uncharacterized protein TNCV_145611 [Trichonephila clavipes]